MLNDVFLWKIFSSLQDFQKSNWKKSKLSF